jgi:hypothetical protein
MTVKFTQENGFWYAEHQAFKAHFGTKKIKTTCLECCDLSFMENHFYNTYLQHIVNKAA